MNSFTINKNIVFYLVIFLIVIPIFGLNFLISFLGNILLLLILVPFLLCLIAFISFNFFKSKLKVCQECGTMSIGLNNTCMNCGADIGDIKINNYEKLNKPGETTIEIKAEEIK